MIFLSLSDFIDGAFNIPDASSSISANTTELQSCIDQYEKKYIYDLLGVTLGNSIIAYQQAGATGNTDYDKLIREYSEDTGLLCGGYLYSLGIKKVLMACIYYEYTKNSYVESLAGTVDQNGEVSGNVGPSARLRKAEKAFNSILITAESIQDICASNSTAYAGYSGKRFVVKGHQFFL